MRIYYDVCKILNKRYTCHKLHICYLGFYLICILSLASPVYGKDMRAASIKAKLDYEAALSEAKKSKDRILKDRALLEKQVSQIQVDVDTLNADIESMQKEFASLKEEENSLLEQQSYDAMDTRELSGIVMGVARELKTILAQSQLTPFIPERLDSLNPIMQKNRFPGIDDFKVLTDLFLQEIKLSGEVMLRPGMFVERNGEKSKGDILTIGKFTAAYNNGKEVGFLKYSEESHQFFALASLPPWSITKNLKKYMQGESEEVYFDLSKGGALRQITHRDGLIDQIRKGGIIVWPILMIGLLAILMAIERTIFLKKVHDNTDRVMGKVNDLAIKGQWQECNEFIQDKKGRPIYNVLKAGLSARGEQRETLESVLQEAILKELPRLERFLPMLNIMGAVAPLLGLLGTVTGMISTFHIITLYGTGDPRMMSGGISEALVTTMLGLAVAIPIMLAHTFLNRRVEHIVGDMEEKAVALTNIIHREIILIE